MSLTYNAENYRVLTPSYPDWTEGGHENFLGELELVVQAIDRVLLDNDVYLEHEDYADLIKRLKELKNEIESVVDESEEHDF